MTRVKIILIKRYLQELKHLLFDSITVGSVDLIAKIICYMFGIQMFPGKGYLCHLETRMIQEIFFLKKQQPNTQKKQNRGFEYMLIFGSLEMGR